MQSTDTGELPERFRFYQSALDLDDLNAGTDYKDLKTSYIIFICVPDILNEEPKAFLMKSLVCVDLLHYNKPFFAIIDYALLFFFDEGAFLVNWEVWSIT